MEKLVERYFPKGVIEGTEDWEEVRDEAERIYLERTDRHGVGDDKSDWFLAIHIRAIRRYLQESQPRS